MKNQLKRSRWLFTSLILLIAILPGSAAAQGSGPTDDDVNAIAKQLYCPVCENIPLVNSGGVLSGINSVKGGPKSRLRRILWTSTATGFWRNLPDVVLTG